MAKMEFEFKDNTKNCLNAIGEDLLKNMTAAVELVKLNTLEMLSHQGMGRQYKVPGVKAYGKWDYENMGTSKRRAGYTRTYTASAPGEPPAQVTGDLKKSVMTNIVIEKDTIIGEVGSGLSYNSKGEGGVGVDYGAMLEYGTMKMLPRPWLRPSFEQSQAEVEDILQQPVGMEIE